MACLIGAKLSSKLLPLPFAKQWTACYWTDYKIAEAWIRSTPQANSSREIFIADTAAKNRLLIPVICWSYISTHDNTADLATRPPVTMEKLKSRRLFQGPEWLTEPSSEWPH